MKEPSVTTPRGDQGQKDPYAPTSAHYRVVICGGGPAGTGPLVHAAHQGALARLLDRGVAIVEAGDRLGGGSFGRYGMTANSIGAAFLECLEHGDDDPVLSAARSLPVTRELRRFRDSSPPLSLVGSYLDGLGDQLHVALSRHPRCDVLLRSRVESIHLRADGTFLARVSERAPGRPPRERRLLADCLIVTLGGTQSRREILSVSPALEPFAEAVVPADAVMRGEAATMDVLARALRARVRVTILGGSHSAWSTAWCLLHRFPRNGPAAAIGPGDVVIVSRHPTRLFYMTPEAAERAGYGFDRVRDVCPLSGRVNRYGGLRGDAGTLARQVLGHGRSRETRIRVVAGPQASTTVAELAAGGSPIVCAFGYAANAVPMYDVDGRPLALQTEHGARVVDRHARLLRADGRAIPNLLAYGLGSGLRVSAEIGGEPSYHGRVDGVWLYQHDVGRVVMRSLLPDRPCRAGSGGPAAHAERVGA